MVNSDPPCDLADARLERRVVEPARLSSEDRAALTRRLYDVHRRIFEGVSVEEFGQHVIDPPAEATIIQLYLEPEGRIVGYCAFHRYRRRVRGQDAIVLSAQAGLLPEYRGRGATYGFGIIRAIREKLLHPATPIYYLGSLVHPSSYHLFYKYFSTLYPNPFYETPPDMLAIARNLADSFPEPPVNPEDPLIREDGWITIETPQEKALNQSKDRPDVKFFRQRNPGYDRGHGLVVLVPITFGNISVALLTRLWERVSIRLGRHRPDL